MGKYLIAGCVMLLVAVANGALRDRTYGRLVGPSTAQQLSTVSGILLLGCVMGLFQRRHPAASGRQAVAIGLFWAALAVAFELLFFHDLGGHSWAALLANYDLAAGRTWV